MSFSNFIVFQLGEIYHFPKQGLLPLHRGMVEGLTPSEVLELRSEGAAPEDAVAMDRKISSTLKRVSLVKKDRFAQSGFGFFLLGKSMFTMCCTNSWFIYCLSFALICWYAFFFYCQESSILRTCVSPWLTLMLLSAAAWQIQWKHGWETSEISFFKTGYAMISGHSLFKSVVINLH